MTSNKTGRSVAIPRRGLPTIRLKTVKDYIQSHLDGRITTVELAELARLNESYFARLFKESTNMTPSRYVRQQRILLAKELLGDPELKLIDISRRVGFEHQSNFARVFRQVVGVNPWQFRRSRL